MAVDEGKEQVDEAVQPDSESYESLLDEYTHLAPAEGEVLQGTVLKVTAKDVIVDFGYKSEGLVPIDQFFGPTGEANVHVGDVIDVMFDHGERPEGYTLLSHSKAARIRVWDNLEKAYEDQLVILGHVIGRVKGGLSVDVGVGAFMPGSQVDPRPIHQPRSVHRPGHSGQNRQTQPEARQCRWFRESWPLRKKSIPRKSTTLGMIREGAVVTGIVKNLTEYGAFIDLGGIDGLLHVTDIS